MHKIFFKMATSIAIAAGSLTATVMISTAKNVFKNYYILKLNGMSDLHYPNYT